jgi:hypothetical protein
MTRLRKMMLEELQRGNHARNTIRHFIRKTEATPTHTLLFDAHGADHDGRGHDFGAPIQPFKREFPFSILSPTKIIPLTSSESNGQSGFRCSAPR